MNDTASNTVELPASDSPAPADARRFALWVTCAGVLLIALIIAADSYEAWQDYRTTLAQNERTQLALSRAVAEQTARMVQEIDVVLVDLAGWRSTAEASGATPQDIEQHLKIELARFPFMQSLAFIAADGHTVATTQSAEAARTNPGDRALLSALQQQKEDVLYVGKRSLAPKEHEPTFAVGRKVLDRDGNFAGIVIARIAFEYLSTFYSTLSVSPNASIRLLREDGAVLTRYPPDDAEVSDDALVRKAFTGPDRVQELIHRDTQSQGRLVALHKVRDYPLVIEAAEPMAAVLTPWRQEETSSAVRTLILAVLAGSLLAALRVALRRRDRLEQERRRLERELKDSQKAEALGFLAASMAHDFNNVLGAIVGYAELARTLSRDNPQAVESVDRLLAASERARQLVRRVLTFDPHRSVNRVPLSVGPLIAEVLELLQQALPPTVTLTTNNLGSHGRILGDATEVHQVAMNLCSNAIRAMPDGGKLDVRLESLQIDRARTATVGKLQSGRWLRLSISDSGVGLAPDQIQAMFEPFYTTRPPGQGYGIGLTVVRNIVGNMGGVIEVASHRGSGTRIGVYWPLIDSGSVVQPTRREPATPGKGQSVLIVDDEPELVRLAEETVASLGYEAIGFADARAALEAFQRAPSRFDAVLTDQRMPMLRGTALAQAIHELRSEVPIILITGCREAETDRQAEQAGVTEILEKPLRKTKLEEALVRVLGTV